MHITKPVVNARGEDFLFPLLLPYEEGYLKVSAIHNIWYAQYGNPQGVAVVVLHGGPGAGCCAHFMRYFDPQYYRIILLDQRGGGQSKPLSALQENTPKHLIADLEQLRELLNIKQWLVFGGSWGSTLALLYGEAHPKSCLGFILRGVFLGRKPEWEQIWEMKDIFPEVWDEFQHFLPAEERTTLFYSYYRRLMDPSPSVHLPAAKAFLKYDTICGFLAISEEMLQQFLEDDAKVLALGRIFAYYCIHGFFLQENQILNNLAPIIHLPAFIIQGRYDVICRAKVAYELYKKWPGSQLTFVSDAGHASIEPGISKALVATTEQFKGILY